MLKITEQQNVGKAKYVVNYYTGKTHKDGSEFYDIAIFKNKVEKDRFIKSLVGKQGANWVPASVGCYWNWADFTISTYVTFENGRPALTFPKSGYMLTRNREECGRFPTLAKAQRAAEDPKAHRFASSGYCPTCGHHGEDCIGRQRRTA